MDNLISEDNVAVKCHLPIAFNIAWYEQKAVIVLLALLSLGVLNIHLGPTLPGFLSPNVGKVLVENFGISGIGTVEDDLELFLQEAQAQTSEKSLTGIKNRRQLEGEPPAFLCLRTEKFKLRTKGIEKSEKVDV
jgi:hypothetical protein